MKRGAKIAYQERERFISRLPTRMGHGFGSSPDRKRAKLEVSVEYLSSDDEEAPLDLTMSDEEEPVCPIPLKRSGGLFDQEIDEELDPIDLPIKRKESKMFQRSLPAPWEKKTTRAGNILYHNTVTGAISTVFPVSHVPEPVSPPPFITSLSSDGPEGEKEKKGTLTKEEISTLLSATTGADLTLDDSFAVSAGLGREPAAGVSDMKELLHQVQEQLSVKLFEHQERAIVWMHRHENHSDCNGGILADDMGCGKTISTIGLMLSNPNPRHKRQHTLIVVPLSLLNQWREELRSRVKSSTLSRVYTHHGAGRVEHESDFKKYDLVLTTYGCLSMEYCIEDGVEFRGPLCRFNWYRVILDEAHSIKNRATRSHKAAASLWAHKRWCLTGTPIQNNLNELQALFSFLVYRPYNDRSYWKQAIMSQLEMYPQETIQILREVVKKIVLRRRKDEVLREKLSLPERAVSIVKIEFREQERTMYDAFEKVIQAKFRAMAKNDREVAKNYLLLLVLLNRLRQACSHPVLTHNDQASVMEDFEGDEAEKQLQLDQAEAIQGQLLGNICSLCLNLDEGKGVTTPCGHKFCNVCIRIWLSKNLNCPVSITDRCVSLQNLTKFMIVELPRQSRGSNEIEYP